MMFSLLDNILNLKYRKYGILSWHVSSYAFQLSSSNNNSQLLLLHMQLVAKTYKIQLAVIIVCCCVYQNTVYNIFRDSFTNKKYRDLYNFLSSNSGKFNVKWIWNNWYLNCGYRWKWRNDHHSKFSNLSNLKEEAWKNQGKFKCIFNIHTGNSYI